MHNRIEHFPISFFSMILGLTGFTIAFQKIEEFIKLNSLFSNIFLGFTLLLFVILSGIYLIKIIKFKEKVKEEFKNPIKINFFPAFSISFLLFSVAFLSVNVEVSKYLWIIGTVFHFIFTLLIVSFWIHNSKIEIKHINPAWFIPAVGNILVPVSGTTHQFVEISWFFYSVGFFFFLTLFIIFFNRIIAHPPLPEKLLPTFFILIAPPAIGFVAYVKLTGNVDSFSKILYYFSLFITILLFAQIKIFYKIKFYLSWWAYSFPVSAITIATILMFHKTHLSALKYTAFGLFSILSILIIILIIKTINAIINKKICEPEE